MHFGKVVRIASLCSHLGESRFGTRSYQALKSTLIASSSCSIAFTNYIGKKTTLLHN